MRPQDLADVWTDDLQPSPAFLGYLFAFTLARDQIRGRNEKANASAEANAFSTNQAQMDRANHTIPEHSPNIASCLDSVLLSGQGEPKRKDSCWHQSHWKGRCEYTHTHAVLPYALWIDKATDRLVSGMLGYPPSRYDPFTDFRRRYGAEPVAGLFLTPMHRFDACRPGQFFDGQCCDSNCTCRCIYRFLERKSGWGEGCYRSS